jgi:hypothetical protein
LTRRAYKVDLGDFSSFVGIKKPEELRAVTHAHVICLAQASGSAWTGALQYPAQALRPLLFYMTISASEAPSPVATPWMA